MLTLFFPGNISTKYSTITVSDYSNMKLLFTALVVTWSSYMVRVFSSQHDIKKTNSGDIITINEMVLQRQYVHSTFKSPRSCELLFKGGQSHHIRGSFRQNFNIIFFYFQYFTLHLNF